MKTLSSFEEFYAVVSSVTSMKHRTGLDRSQTLLFHEWLEDYIAAENPVRFLDAFAAKLAERENPQITQIAQISFPPSASSAKSADKTPRPPASDFGETSRCDAASCFDAARSAEQLNNKATKKQSFAALVTQP